MKRTEFKRKAPPLRPGRQYEGKSAGVRGPVLRLVAPAPRDVVPEPKREYVRSKPMMKAYRTIACQHCGTDDGTVCGAHSNWEAHGKGGHIKADDNRGASLCVRCHSELDQGSKLTEAQRRRLWWHAHVATVALLLFNGTWPAGVPVPLTLEYPREWA